MQEGEYEHAKLESLKDELREAPAPISDYNHPSHFSELLEDQLRAAVDASFPADTHLTVTESERFRHLSFAKSLRKIYLPPQVRWPHGVRA